METAVNAVTPPSHHSALKLACLAAMLLAQPALAEPVDKAPAQTVMPGSVSMSAQPSFNTLGFLKTQLSPADMLEVQTYLQQSVMATAMRRPITMSPDLAHKLFVVRERVKNTQPVAAKSIDLLFGPTMKAALQTSASNADVAKP
jgi:hypothetical protein